MRSLIEELEFNIHDRWLGMFHIGIQSLLDRCEFKIWGHEGKFNGITLRTTNKLVARDLAKRRTELTAKARHLLGNNAEIKIIFWREELLGEEVFMQSVEGEDFLVAFPKNNDRNDCTESPIQF
jgi:hypothetical protein